MDAFFLKQFKSYKDFHEEFLKWQDENFQYITIEKSDKLNALLFSGNVKSQFVYERVKFKCRHDEFKIKKMNF